jgi:hypothetical protein
MNSGTIDFNHTKATDEVAFHHSETVNLFDSLDCTFTHRDAITDQRHEMSLSPETMDLIYSNIWKIPRTEVGHMRSIVPKNDTTTKQEVPRRTNRLLL